MKSYGTEGRELLDTTGASTFVPPNDGVHADLLFRGQGIQDLHVHEKPKDVEKAAAAPPNPGQEEVLATNDMVTTTPIAVPVTNSGPAADNRPVADDGPAATEVLPRVAPWGLIGVVPAADNLCEATWGTTDDGPAATSTSAMVAAAAGADRDHLANNGDRVSRSPHAPKEWAVPINVEQRSPAEANNGLGARQAVSVALIVKMGTSIRRSGGTTRPAGVPSTVAPDDGGSDDDLGSEIWRSSCTGRAAVARAAREATPAAAAGSERKRLTNEEATIAFASAPRENAAAAPPNPGQEEVLAAADMVTTTTTPIAVPVANSGLVADDRPAADDGPAATEVLPRVAPWRYYQVLDSL